MVRVITFASGKGGVGKTTIVANLGIALSRQGQRVLLVDADVAMANLSLILGMESSPITLNDVLKGEAKVEDVIYNGPGGTHIIPSSLELQNFKNLDLSQLPNIVKKLTTRYDFILLDCPAGIGEDTLITMSASTEVFLVVNPYSLSIADALKAKMTAQRINAKPVGILVNMAGYYKGEIEEKDIIRMMELPTYGTIPFDEEVRKAFFYKKIEPIIIKNPECPASIAFNQVAARILGKEIQNTPIITKKGFLDWLKNLFKKRD